MKYLKLSFLSVFSLSLLCSSSFAQLNLDSRAMYDRMDRLERDITLLQRRIYKTDSSEQTAKSDAENKVNAPVGSVEHLYSKISEQDQIISQMTAQLEELDYHFNQAQEDLKKMKADIELRFEELQKNSALSTVSSTDPIEQTEVKKEDLTALPTDAKSAYNAAHDLLKQFKYEQAQQALIDFLEKYPEDEYAGNAQYWLGETYYVRHQYEQAAIAFSTGFKKYKDNSKAADNLLKLGLSMLQLGKQKEACTAFKALKKEFPSASATILSRADAEAKKLGCYK